MTQAINLVAAAILFLCRLVLALVGFVDSFLAALMTRAGINPQAQTAILIVVAVVLIVGVVRRLGRVFGLLLLILLVLLLLRWAMPELNVPSRLPTAWLPAAWLPAAWLPR